MLIASILTAFNDNAAITYLGALAPGFTDSLKYAVVAGAVAGGSRQAQSLRNRRLDRISLQDLALDSSGFHGYFNSDQNQFSSFIPLTLLNSLILFVTRIKL